MNTFCDHDFRNVGYASVHPFRRKNNLTKKKKKKKKRKKKKRGNKTANRSKYNAQLYLINSFLRTSSLLIAFHHLFCNNHPRFTPACPVWICFIRSRFRGNVPL